MATILIEIFKNALLEKKTAREKKCTRFLLFLKSFQNMALNWWTEQLLEFHSYILVEITTNRCRKKNRKIAIFRKIERQTPLSLPSFRAGESRRPNSNGNLGSKLPVGWPSSIATGKLATNWGAWWLGLRVRRVEVVSSHREFFKRTNGGFVC